MSVYCYLRVSTDSQDVDSQRIGIREFCEKHGWEIDGWTEDEGVSGAEAPWHPAIFSKETAMRYDKQMTFEDISSEYSAFVDKFKPKKTTDDCYTPENVFEAVRDWTCAKYGIDPAAIVRPFWPGGDFERFDYPAGCFVLDNPPFSILARIVKFYQRHGIRYLLFAPALTMFNLIRHGTKCLCVGTTIIYENGAGINTGFVTSEGEWLVETCPDLHDILEESNKRNARKGKKKVRKLEFPMNVATSARLSWLAVHGTAFRIRKEDAAWQSNLDNSPTFGGCLLLSERAAAERVGVECAAAERAAAGAAAAAAAAAVEHVPLSERELEIIKRLG